MKMLIGRSMSLLMALFISSTLNAANEQVANSEFKLHSLFTDGAVLQRDMEIPIFGRGEDGQKVTVTLADHTADTVVKDGCWLVKLPKREAGGPYKLVVEGSSKIEINDVWVGEVWLCSGQSNMGFRLISAENGEQDAAAANHPMIRLFSVPKGGKANQPLQDVQSQWRVCTPEIAQRFSAVGYYFGRDLQKALNVPIGLIDSSVGGTPAQAWMSKEALESIPAGRVHLDAYAEVMAQADAYEARYQRAVKKWQTAKDEESQTDVKAGPQPRLPETRSDRRPACLYNNMIHPLKPFAMRGVIWYQGESNSTAPENYAELLPGLIKNWRADIQPDLAFYMVQLAPFDKPAPEAWAWFREVQRRISIQVPNTAMVSIPDAGNPVDVHPIQKEPVGVRLARAALANTYGQKLEWSGPAFQKVEFKEGKALVTFAHADGLVAKEKAVSGFIIAGEDKVFYPAEASLKGNVVEVSSAQVSQPKAVRYGWKNMPDGNLWNAADLPASPFKTDDWPRQLEGTVPQPGLFETEFVFEKAPHPECHAPTIVETSDGLVAAWFGGTKEGHPDVGIWLSRLVEGKWTKPVEVANGAETEDPRRFCMNPVLVQIPNGPLQLHYKTGSWWAYVKRSTDGGRTWSKPSRLPNGFFGPIKNKPVFLSDGSLLSPTSTEMETPEGTAWKVHFERSTNQGKSWQMIGPVNDGLTIHAIQPSILIHGEKRLQAIGRTQEGKLFDVWSDDLGKTWGEMGLLNLPNNNSGTDAVTLDDGRQLLVYNHSGLIPGREHPAGYRSPLNVAVSDNGKDWLAAMVLETERGREFSYPAVIQTKDGFVHILYTWKREKIKHVTIDPNRLMPKPIVDGVWPDSVGGKNK